VRLGEDEDDGEEGRGGGGGDRAIRQLKMELEEVKQQLMRQEALAAEARATGSMAQQELHYWRQRVTELEPGDECLSSP
jgi:predicted Zn-dependent protease